MRRALTFTEIMVASSLLALISLVSFNLMMILQRANATVSQNVDIGSNARRIVSEIARDLRQTGWTYEEATKTNHERCPTTGANASLAGFGTTVFGDTDAGQLPVLCFRVRTGFTEDIEEDWADFVEYSVIQDGTFTNVAGTPTRYALQRRSATDSDGDGDVTGETIRTVVIARDLSRVAFTRPDGGDSAVLTDDRNIDIRVALTRMNPDGSAGVPPPGITVEYRERVRMANLPEERD